MFGQLYSTQTILLLRPLYSTQTILLFRLLYSTQTILHQKENTLQVCSKLHYLKGRERARILERGWEALKGKTDKEVQFRYCKQKEKFVALCHFINSIRGSSQ